MSILPPAACGMFFLPLVAGKCSGGFTSNHLIQSQLPSWRRLPMGKIGFNDAGTLGGGRDPCPSPPEGSSALLCATTSSIDKSIFTLNPIEIIYLAA